MNHSLKDYTLMNRLNAIIVENMVDITMLQEGDESFEKIACFCFTKAYSICKRMIEESPSPIWRIPDYYRETRYKSKDNNLNTVIKAIILSIVLIWAEHLDEKWRSENDTILNKMKDELNKLFISGETINMLGHEMLNPFGGTSTCMRAYICLRNNTNIDYIIPLDHFDSQHKNISKEDNVSQEVNDLRKEVYALREENVELLAKINKINDDVLISEEQFEAIFPKDETSQIDELSQPRSTTDIDNLQKQLADAQKTIEELNLAIQSYKEQGKGLSAPEAAILMTAICLELNQMPANGREGLAPTIELIWGKSNSTAAEALRRKVTQKTADKLASAFESITPKIARLIRELPQKLEKIKNDRLIEINPNVN